MRIALVAPYFYPVSGGKEVTVLALAEGLAKKGHSVTVITTDRTPDGKIVEKRNEHRDFSVQRIKSAFLAFRFEIPLHLPNLTNYDVVHIISTDDVFTFIFLLSAKARRKHVLATIFTPFALLSHPRKVLRPFLSFFELLSFISMYLADCVQVKNEIDLNIMKKFIKTVKLIPDGIPANYITGASSIDFRKAHGLEKKKIILFVNRIHPLKGPQLLIKAMPEIIKDYPDAVAVLIGPDTNGYIDELKSMAQKVGILGKVLFMGFVGDDAKMAAYDAADVVAIPSIGEFTEGFSIVLSEAWARGKTVVVTPSRALRSRVVPGTSYIAGYNAKSLAEAIKKGLAEPTVPPKVNSWDEVVDMIEKEYLRMVEL